MRPQLNFLSALRSEIYGFRPAALVFSLPRALCLWGLGLLLAQAILLTFRLLYLSLAIGMATFILLVVLGTGRIVSPDAYWLFSQMVENWFILFRGYVQILLRCSR